jgi:putative transposase
MKGKRYTTEDKIRILRQADAGKSVLDVCREHNISEVSLHGWKRQFGQMEVNEARRLKDLERENTELKKMLAEALLRILGNNIQVRVPSIVGYRYQLQHWRRLSANMLGR